jgi:hypothetical protein
MVEEATADCYNEDDQATGLFTLIEDNLAVPFPTEVPYLACALKRGTEESNLEQGFWRPLCKPQYLAQPSQKPSPQLHFSLHFSGAGERRLGYGGNHQCHTRVPAEPDASLSAAKQIGRYTHGAARADAKPATVSTPSSSRASFSRSLQALPSHAPVERLEQQLRRTPPYPPSMH